MQTQLATTSGQPVFSLLCGYSRLLDKAELSHCSERKIGLTGVCSDSFCLRRYYGVPTEIFRLFRGAMLSLFFPLLAAKFASVLRRQTSLAYFGRINEPI